MKISYQWLQTYFQEKLPAPRELAELFTMYAFEVESVDEVEMLGDGARRDYVFDIKVLPNRAHDCLSHRGVAREVGVLLGRDIQTSPYTQTTEFNSDAIHIKISDPALCSRYSAALIRGIKVGPSPMWLKERVEAVGQKSINNVVDATNYVMFALGQPLHAFDVKKLIARDNRYGILVRTAKEGESVAALDGKTYTLNTHTLVITDAHCKDNKILGIAGIKGGVAAQIDADTTDILLESAHFDPVRIRTTAKALGLRTDASVRFENGITPELTREALQDVARLIVDIASGTIDALVDVRAIEPLPATCIDFSLSDIEQVLGFAIPHKKIITILKHIGCTVLEKHTEGASGDVALSITVPHERLDLQIKEDLIEEIGRVYGFFNVPPIEPQRVVSAASLDAYTACSFAIQNILTGLGFSEVYTYTFGSTGERVLENPIASDKQYLRADLQTGLAHSLEINKHNAPLLGIRDFVRIFEIGKVFSEKEEYVHVGVALMPVGKIKNVESVITHTMDSVQTELETVLGISLVNVASEKTPHIREFNIQKALVQPPTLEIPRMTNSTLGFRFKNISPYPFVLRDIAVFVPEGVTQDAVEALLRKESGPLLTRLDLFDVFSKKFDDGVSKTSYAFSLVFQSDEKTLSDDEVGEIMKKVTDTLNAQTGWQVR